MLRLSPLRSAAAAAASTGRAAIAVVAAHGHRALASDAGQSTANPAEIAKFNALAAQWWDPRGEMALLHRMNPVRVGYVRDWLAATGKLAAAPSEASAPPSLRGTRLLDVGCGAGLLSEALARLGADQVVGLDAAEQNVRVAETHARRDPRLRHRMDAGALQYVCGTAENLAATGPEPFTAVCALEIIEHVDHPSAFLASLLSLVPPGGLVFISTMNRTPLASFLTVTLAEDVLRIVARGTHDSRKYVTPAELKRMAWAAGGQVLDVEGLWLNPLTRTWSRGSAGVPEAGLVNYIACIRRRG